MALEWKRTRIWNDSDREWVELFNDEKVVIPAGGYIEMSRHDATRFMGQWFDPVDKETKQIIYQKKLRKEPVYIDADDPLSGLKKTMCVICRKDCGSVMILEKHMKKHHPGALPTKEEDKKDDSERTGDTGKV